MKDHAEVLLQQMLGPGAAFREGQWEAIRDIVEDRSRILVVQKTGWGKSLVYFIASRLLRDRGSGPTFLISPLLALMRNQIAIAERIGIHALSVNSANRSEWAAVEKALTEDTCDVLLVSPERLANETFMRGMIPAVRRGIGLFVIDEAHCISDWGHDFRPDYRRITRIVNSLPPTVPVLATTATANDRVVADIVEQLGWGKVSQQRSGLPWGLAPASTEQSQPELIVQRGSLARPSLRIQVIRLDSQAERLAWLAEQIPRFPGSGIVYCLTIVDTERVADWLTLQGIEAAAYHSEISPDVRTELEERLLRNEVKVLVATVALGMGFDKPDLGFVVHYQRPGSVVAYYQQIGRAGRAVDDAYAILLNGSEDDQIQDYFIRTAFPGVAQITEVLDVVEAGEGVTQGQILSHVNLSQSRVQQCLKLLEIDGAVEHESGRYWRTANQWKPDEARWEQITELRRGELTRMQAYVSAQSCLMEFIARELDDPTAQPCGRCAVCAGPIVGSSTEIGRVIDATAFLKRDARRIEPRRQWPVGEDFPEGRIDPDLRNAEGRALCVYGDAGWGQAVADGKYRTGRFSDELVQAAAALVRERWSPEPFPHWVTAVPSLRHPTLVPDFTQRLAATLGLPFHPVLIKVRETAEQKTMENSAQQVANILTAFEPVANVSSGPVLLVDDIVDSRWTLTLCGAALREAGSGIVHPFALATAAGTKRAP